MVDSTLVHFKTKENFKREKGNIQDTSIAFIKDSKQISTHDTIYNFVNWNVLDDNTEEVPPVKLITFTIDGVEYQAVENMTWGEWINSSYNTGSFYTGRNDTIYSLSGAAVLAPLYGASQLSNDIIYSGYQYIIGSHSGGIN